MMDTEVRARSLGQHWVCGAGGLVGYSPRRHEELDLTKRLSAAQPGTTLGHRTPVHPGAPRSISGLSSRDASLGPSAVIT